MREKALYAVIVVYYASDVAWHWLHDPFKVTDPDDPRFDPYRFKFKDYKSDSQRFLAFKKMFSPGNSREYVEKILVDSAEGKRHEIASGYVGYYWVPWWWTGDSYGVTVVYDANDRLIAMRTHNTIIFGSEELKLVGERLVVQARERAIIKERQRKGIKP